MSRTVSDRRSAKAARRAAVSGSGPIPGGDAPGRNPGAIGAFSLFGEVLMVGILVTVIGLAVVTVPVALAAGVQHLRRFIAAEESGLHLFWRDVRRGIVGGVVLGSAVLATVLLLIVDITLAGSGDLPGGALVGAFGWAGLAVVGAALLSAVGAWSPELGWRKAVRGTAQRLRSDVPGSLYLVAVVGFVGVLTWALPPLILPALGCAALAVVAIPERPGAGGQS